MFSLFVRNKKILTVNHRITIYHLHEKYFFFRSTQTLYIRHATKFHLKKMLIFTEKKNLNWVCLMDYRKMCVDFRRRDYTVRTVVVILQNNFPIKSYRELILTFLALAWQAHSHYNDLRTNNKIIKWIYLLGNKSNLP